MLLRILIFLTALSATPAMADPCMAQVQALFDGPLDPLQRGPYRSETQVMTREGQVMRVFDTITQTPQRAITTERGSGLHMLVYDDRRWTGPSPDGPWTPAVQSLPEPSPRALRGRLAERRANLANPVCAGPEDIGGRQLLRFSFTTQSDLPGAGGTLAQQETVWTDPQTGQVLIHARSGFQAPVSPLASVTRPQEVHVTRYAPDPELRIAAPTE
ncbi:hypothetical protein [Pseudooceanicola aestuarii]|uniref:hypothetical protein n=1 Tax=Pseudooceanicola aestuarii TaxID=2697319 RepID=UPI0013D6A07D|nr:hypothetical protein [Pseudooceanicola aestuarii]